MPRRLTQFCRFAGLTVLAAGLALLLTGCGAVVKPLASSSSGTLSAISGHVHGGAQTVTGSRIYLFAAGTSGYGGPSVPIINPQFPGVSVDANGPYVVSDGNGYFNLGGTYSCTPGQQIYALAKGGNPGLAPGTDNPALVLISALGNCPDTGNFAATIPALNITEVTTVAAAYSLAGFMTDAFHLSAPSTTLAQQGLANAFLPVMNLVNVGSGDAVPISIVNNGVPPRATLNTLANMITACVNTTGNSGPCSTLFSNAKSLAGATPTDTTSAMINIAHNPGANVGALFALAAPAPPFQPSLGAAPNDWTLAITYYADNLAGPYYPAVDNVGNLWIPGYANNTITEFNPLGAPISGQGGFAGNGLSQPYNIAIDSGQSVWAGNYSYGQPASISRFSASGAASGFSACGNNCTGVAFDRLQNIWIAGTSGVTVLHNSGSPDAQFTTSSITPSRIPAIAVDSAGNGWTLGAKQTLYRLTLPNAVTPFAETITSTLPNDLNLLAIDSSDNVWFTSGKNNALGRFDRTGQLVSPANGYTGGGLKYPAQLAIDGSNRVWVANRDGNSISAFNNDGSAITSATGYQPSGQGSPDPSIPIELTGVRSPHGLAIDGSGNVWVTNFVSNSVTEFLGIATPVVTPLNPATLGQRP